MNTLYTAMGVFGLGCIIVGFYIFNNTMKNSAKFDFDDLTRHAVYSGILLCGGIPLVVLGLFPL